MDTNILTTKEAAQFLKVSLPKLYQLKASVKDFPFHKVGEKVLFTKEELTQWLLKQ